MAADVANRSASAVDTRARKALGSPPKSRQRPKRLRIFGFSPHIVPDTEAAGVATGYWHKPLVDWQPSADLVQFLKTDRPVVVVGFGSIASRDPAKMHRIVVETAELASCRIVYLSGWTQQVEADSHNDVLSLKDVPHSWLFPRVQAVVHHGGAGTTGAAFAAGMPQVIVPFGVDQPFWASRVAALGTGPGALSRLRLQARTLADSVLKVTAGPYRQRALAIAELLRVEQGAATAAHLISKSAAMNQK